MNKGETAIVDIYVSGYGDIEGCKLHVQYNQPKLVDGDKPSEIEYLSSSITEPTDELSEHGFVSSLPLRSFSAVTGIDGSSMPPVKTEVGKGEDPPIQLNLHISREATPGNYTIPITFTYKGEEGLRQSQDAVDVHVNNFREKHNRGVAIAGMTVGTAALLRFFGIGFQKIQTAANWFVEFICSLGL